MRILLITVFAALAMFVPTISANAAPADERVIVELAVPASAGSDQITAATDSLLALLPVGSYTVNNRYTTLPFVGLSADSDALRAIRASNLVTAVHRDGVVSASGSKKKPGCKTKKQKKLKRCKSKKQR